VAEGRSLDELYRAHFSTVRRRCQRILGNPDDAADAAHEVFVRAIESLPVAIPDEAIRGWLLAVAHNYCLDLLRERKRLDRVVRNGQALAEAGDPETTTITRQTLAAVFAQLRLRERQALWQSSVEGYSLARMARNFGLTYMAMAQLLHRARRHASVLAGRVAAVGLFFLRRPSAPAAAQSGVRLVLTLATLPVLAIAIPASVAAEHSARPAVVSSSSGSAAAGGPSEIRRPASSGSTAANPSAGQSRASGGSLLLTGNGSTPGALTRELRRIQSCLPQPASSAVAAVNVKEAVPSIARCVAAPPPP
jgi:RNA polymerase sigma-70 factor (ECF subfamily)